MATILDKINRDHFHPSLLNCPCIKICSSSLVTAQREEKDQELNFSLITNLFLIFGPHGQVANYFTTDDSL